MRQPVPRTTALATDLVGLVEEDGDPAKLAIAYRALGYSLVIAGQFREAAELLARGVALADTISQSEFVIYGEHPSMVCRSYGGAAKILMGFPESGMRLIEASIAHARRQNNAHSLAWALGVAALTTMANAAATYCCASNPQPKGLIQSFNDQFACSASRFRGPRSARPTSRLQNLHV
jgi:hypothetical protein